MKFVDSITVCVRSGDGGDGLVSFRSAKNLPKLGADGGDGGDGGSFYFRGDKSLNTLAHLRHMQKYSAKDGCRGGSNGCTGAAGLDRVVLVPLGTIVRDQESGDVLVEVISEGEDCLLLKGGAHGLGNLRYLSSTHQAPENYTLGKAGQTLVVDLELKLIADVGLAGFPNAGKSTLLSCLSAARPKVADYPFTTLQPSLGVVSLSEVVDDYGASFVMADIPGLIEGASDGKGLGHDFLKHLERTSVILYLIDPFSYDYESPLDSFRQLELELSRYSEEFLEKPTLVVLSKADLLAQESLDEFQSLFSGHGYDCSIISSATGRGIVDLKRRIHQMILEKPTLKVEQVKNEPLPQQLINSYHFLSRSAVNAELGL